ncbi:tRNA (adenosine(37)-N6)-threonylcarbamoyltransferase complex transferase subunit TsaD [Derxia lacustris]|uniref:tRNA (adenosine(37)-N6)-threonylcarbamoyltransferase complex transferase subunit TsaD n=1 Tax=Derxia lacustris TaxID=764842 RepID=UPI000A16EF37|nr:tRNA (adenosine(37)-N6)-threonylcarbamoyltransferase complex transferase subunit TsaD [Derxia lacustris]
MLVLGFESSCDETGVALYDDARGLLAHGLHSQIAMHREYGGVVPELASRDHVRRLVPLLRGVLADAGVALPEVDAVAVTAGPGLAGALLVGASFGHAVAVALGKPVIEVHHLEGHLLSPLLEADAPGFPFVALLVSGGHTQLMQVDGVGRYTLLGETVDDAAGEAFDKTAKLLGLPYPGGPEISRLAEQGDASAFTFPRPLKHSGDFNFSFAGLKTSVLTAVRKIGTPTETQRAHIAAAVVDAITDVLTAKAVAALKSTGMKTLVVSGGVGANRQLRARLDDAARRHRFRVHYPRLDLCTDNGAMIAFAAAKRWAVDPALARPAGVIEVRPRWPLA